MSGKKGLADNILADREEDVKAGPQKQTSPATVSRSFPDTAVPLYSRCWHAATVGVFTCLFHCDPDDVRGHDFDDVQLQQPPHKDLHLMKVLQEFQKEHCEAVDHQVPLVL